MSEETLVKQLKEHVKVEKNFVAAVDQQLKNVHNAAAKLLLLETQKDSEKHAVILEGILEVISQKKGKRLWDTLLDSYVDKTLFRRNLENHVNIEKAMLEHIDQEMAETKDEGIKLLLEHIASDEKKHHKILQTIMENAYKIKP